MIGNISTKKEQLQGLVFTSTLSVVQEQLLSTSDVLNSFKVSH